MLHRIAHAFSLKFPLLCTAVGCQCHDANCRRIGEREKCRGCGGMRFPVSRTAGLSDIVLGCEGMQLKDESVWCTTVEY
jgi:hypothetical protein